MRAQDPIEAIVVHTGELEPPKTSGELPSIRDNAEEVRLRILDRFAREAACGPIEPATVAAGKVVLDYIASQAPTKPRSARETLEAVRRALPDLERRAALEGGEEPKPAPTPADLGEW